MKTVFASFLQRRLRTCGLLAACGMAAGSLWAQSPQARIASEISVSQLTTLNGSQHPLAQARFDAGRVPSATKLDGITLVFNRSAQQEADLQALIKAQQDPSSPLFHKWLTPDEFAARFGMAQEDIDKVQAWLERQGFTVESINRSHNAIHFSGSAGQVEQAFSTEMHYYNVGGKKHFAPATALSVPASVAPVITAIRNLDDFRPRPMHFRGRPMNAKPQYTYCGDASCTTANEGVLFAPEDIWTTYNINALRSASNNGSGQTIAIMGQSQISTTDITNFQDAAGLTEQVPTITLVPNTGSSTVSSGDESESDIDIEWSGAIATGATINFVYTGSDQNTGVFDSYQYAVDQQIGNIISISYGGCETDLGQSNFTALEQIGEQATSQGQTVIASSGDSGATACYGDTDVTAAQQDALAVNYPASSAYVTGVGGTEISAADDAVGTYWTSAASTSTGILLSSATQWIPEIAWNDNATAAVSGCTSNYLCVSASGGGYSALGPQPTWQTSYFTATGHSNPKSSARLVPDIALYASPNYPGYVYCSSDQSAWSSGQEGSCGSDQFYDPQSQYFTVAGGTSFGAPIFAGMVAIMNQAKGYTSGQGLVNTELYKLAQSSSTYASAFHDVTSGNNECTESSAYCPSNGGYSAGTGYDLVTGLGSVNLGNMVTAWPESTSTVVGTQTTITATSTNPTAGTSDTFTITVAAASGTTPPAGTVQVSINGGTATSYTLTASTTTAASTATFSNTFTTAGSYTVSAQFKPTDTTAFSSSTGTTTVTVQAVSSGKGTITVAATPSTLTVSQGSSGTETVAVTPAGGYTGTVLLGLDFGTSGDNSLQNLCGGFAGANNSGQGSVVIGSTTAVSTTLTLDTNASDCSSTAAIAKTGMRPMRAFLTHRTAKNSGGNPLPAGIAFGVLLLSGFLGRHSRKFRNVVAVLALAAAGLAISACGSSTTSTTVSNPPKGTYTGTITATDSVTSTITSTTTFTFVID